MKQIVAMLSIFAFQSFASDGSVGSPFDISTCTGLENVKDDLTAHYQLINDIDCSESKNWNEGKGFQTIGTNAWSIDGKFQ